MRTETGVLQGLVIVVDEFDLRGIADGDVVVREAGHLNLRGICARDLTIERGGVAILRGIVSGNVLNHGSLEVYGIINGTLTETPGATTFVSPDAVIANER